jgi:hypothetical protein
VGSGKGPRVDVLITQLQYDILRIPVPVIRQSGQRAISAVDLGGGWGSSDARRLFGERVLVELLAATRR